MFVAKNKKKYIAAVVYHYTVDKISRSMSTVTHTTRRLPTSSRRTLSPPATAHNGVYKPTVMTLTLPESAASVSLAGTVNSSERTPAESDGIWIHVGVGIAALVVIVVIGILVSQ